MNIMRQRWWIVISITLAGLSGLALYYIINNVWPDPNQLVALPQLLFLLFVFLGLSASVVPITAYLNHRFAKPDWYQRDRGRLVRQGAWVGLFGVVLAYLQLIRALNWTIAAVLAGVLSLIETFFLTRE
jgi:hypothetical protein